MLKFALIKDLYVGIERLKQGFVRFIFSANIFFSVDFLVILMADLFFGWAEVCATREKNDFYLPRDHFI